MVQQAIEHGGDGGAVAEQFAPVINGTIGCNQRAGALIAAHDDLQQFFGGGQWQLAHAEIVDDQQEKRNRHCSRWGCGTCLRQLHFGVVRVSGRNRPAQEGASSMGDPRGRRAVCGGRADIAQTGGETVKSPMRRLTIGFDTNLWKPGVVGSIPGRFL